MKPRNVGKTSRLSLPKTNLAMCWLATLWLAGKRGWLVYFRRADGRTFFKNVINPNVFLPCQRDDMRRMKKQAKTVYA